LEKRLEPARKGAQRAQDVPFWESSITLLEQKRSEDEDECARSPPTDGDGRESERDLLGEGSVHTRDRKRLPRRQAPPWPASEERDLRAR
jgi:hypothetical protein